MTILIESTKLFIKKGQDVMCPDLIFIKAFPKMIY
jgi:hypothetical protein